MEQQYDPGLTPRRNVSAYMARSSFIEGILSILTCFTFTVFPAFVFGSLSLVMANLSRGYDKKFSKVAKRGILLAICGLVLNCCILGYTTLHFLSSYQTDGAFRQQVNEMCEEQYGYSFDDMINMLQDSSAEVREVPNGNEVI